MDLDLTWTIVIDKLLTSRRTTGDTRPFVHFSRLIPTHRVLLVEMGTLDSTQASNGDPTITVSICANWWFSLSWGCDRKMARSVPWDICASFDSRR